MMMTSDEPRVGDDDLLCKRTEKNRLLFSPRDRSSPVNENGRCRSNRSRSRRVRFGRSELRVCVPRTLARVCPQTFSLSWTSRAAQSDARRHGARPHATAGSCFGGRLDWCRHLPSRCVSSRTVTTARSSHLCPPRAGRVPRPDPSNNATRPSRRPQPLGRCGRRDDVHAALPRRLRDATPRFPLRGPLALSLSPSREQARSAFGRETDRNLRVPLQPRASPSQLVLDKESFTLEELLEEDDVIQECKSLNSRLVNLCVPPAKPRSRPATRHAHAFPLRVRRSFSRASSNQPSPRMFRSFVASSAASTARGVPRAPPDPLN